MRWLYRDAEGNPLFWVYRFEFPDTVKKEILPVSYGAGGWHFKGLPAPRPLYNLHLLAQHPSATVIVTEGEKAADAASQLFPLPDYVVTTSPNGAQAASKTDWQLLAGRRAIIWPDLDEPGRKYAETVAALIPMAAVSILNAGVFGVHILFGILALVALAPKIVKALAIGLFFLLVTGILFWIVYSIAQSLGAIPVSIIIGALIIAAAIKSK